MRNVPILSTLPLTMLTNLWTITYLGKTYEDLILEELGSYGYSKPTDPAFLQSFSEESIEKLSTRTELPLSLLLSSGVAPSDERLIAWAQICYAIGPNKQLIVNHQNLQNGVKNWIFEVHVV